MTPDESPLILGRIAGLFGVKGWVKVFSYTDPREAVLNYGDWMLQQNGQWTDAKVAEGQRHGKSVIARLNGIDDRDAAAELVGAEIGVSRSALPPADEGHYYWSDLIGLEVMHLDGKCLGHVTAMLETGAHDVMVVKGDIERLVPFVLDKTVQSVDLQTGKISVDWEWE